MGLICEHCKKEIDIASKYCNFCGKKLDLSKRREEVKELLEIIFNNPLLWEKLFHSFIKVSAKQKGIPLKAFNEFFDNLDIKEKLFIKNQLNKEP